MSRLPRWLYPLVFVALAACGQGAVSSSSPEVVPEAATATAPSMAAPPSTPTSTTAQAPALTPELLPELPPELTAGIDALIACAGRDEFYWLEHGAPILTPELAECVADELGAAQ